MPVRKNESRRFGARGLRARNAVCTRPMVFDAVTRRYGSLEPLLKAGRFPKEAAELRLYKSIGTMDRKAPLPKLRG